MQFTSNFLKKIKLLITKFICKKNFINPSDLRKNIKHVAIIADGNRRWAKNLGLSTLEGHRKGFVDVAPQISEELWRMGVHTVTIWCLSTGNWKREKNEIENLLEISDLMIKKIVSISKKQGIRIVHLGRKDRLPNFLLQTILEAEQLTQSFTNNVFNVAIDYGGQDEILRAFKKCEALKLENSAKSLSCEHFSAYLDTGDQPYPNPDLIIRSGKELRLSGFMMWQSLYSELYFTSKFFPEFDEELLQEAIHDYLGRKRTFSQ